MLDLEVFLSITNCLDAGAWNYRSLRPTSNLHTGSVVRLLISLLPAQRRMPLLVRPHPTESPLMVTSSSLASPGHVSGIKSESEPTFPEKPLPVACAVVEDNWAWLLLLGPEGSAKQRDLTHLKPPGRMALTVLLSPLTLSSTPQPLSECRKILPRIQKTGKNNLTEIGKLKQSPNQKTAPRNL